MAQSKLALVLVVALSLPGVVSAQETEQAAVVGPSGNADWPLVVRGANDVLYHCRDRTQRANGRVERRCRRADDMGIAPAGTGALGMNTGGLSMSEALGAALFGIIAFAAASDTM